MAYNVSRLTRLSYTKTMGNLVVIGSLFLYLIIFVNLFNPVFSSPNLQTAILGYSFLCLLVAFLADRYLRKPFSKAITRYMLDLTDRRLNTQQIAIEVDMIETLLPLGSLKQTMRTIDTHYKAIKKIQEQTRTELSQPAPKKSSQISHELQLIKQMTDNSLHEISKKKENLLFLAKTRKGILSTINHSLSRPRNEIDFDYLVYKVQKNFLHHDIDTVLLKQVIDSMFEQGELAGRLKRNVSGEVVLTLGKNFVPTRQEDLVDLETFWEERENYRPRKQCVICRRGINPSEPEGICPTCHTSFHKTHLLEWLKVFNRCPICHERLTLFATS